MEKQTNNPCPPPCCLRGLVTDLDLELADQEFPGIARFYASRPGRDGTFLELLAAFLASADCRIAA